MRLCTSQVAWCLVLLLVSTSSSLLLAVRTPMARIFSIDGAVMRETSALMPFTILYAALAALSTGWAQQVQFGLGVGLVPAACINIVSFYLIGIPLGAWLAYSSGWGVRGLWTGLDIAMALLTVGQYSHMVSSVDWGLAARKARAKVLERGADGDVCGGKKTAHGNKTSDGHALRTADGYEANGKQLAIELEASHRYVRTIPSP